MRCTTGAGAGGGGGAVLVLEREMQPEPSVAAARTNPRGKNFIMQVPSAKTISLVAKSILQGCHVACRPFKRPSATKRVIGLKLC